MEKLSTIPHPVKDLCRLGRVSRASLEAGQMMRCLAKLKLLHLLTESTVVLAPKLHFSHNKAFHILSWPFCHGSWVPTCHKRLQHLQYKYCRPQRSHSLGATSSASNAYGRDAYFSRSMAERSLP